jgi:CRP/FNR family transcriptional regulator
MVISLHDLQSLTALRHFSPDRLASLAQVMVQRSYAPGELIFLEGETAKGIWFVARGQVKIIKFSANGRVQALCTVNRGKCFGTCPLFNKETNPATAQAVNDVTLMILPEHAARELLHQDYTLVQALLQIYSERLAQLAHLSEALGAWNVATRLNNCLLTHADLSEQQPIVRLTHEKLAELTGTVREVVSRHLSRLAANGIVAVDSGCITLIDPVALRLPCFSVAS